MEKHSNKRKLYIDTKCSTKSIDFGKVVNIVEEIMKKYLLTEEKLLTYTYKECYPVGIIPNLDMKILLFLAIKYLKQKILIRY